MDPNQTLWNIRESIAEMDNNELTIEAHAHSAQELSTAVEALDQWLSKGGFLPKAWERPC